VGSGTPTSTITNDREEPTVRENEGAQFNPDIKWLDVSIDETVPTLLSATIDCPTQSDPGPSNAIFQSSPEGRQRPSRKVHRPPRYRDSSFETQFQPIQRRRNCRKIQKRNPTGYDVTNVGEYQDLGRGENNENTTPTGNEMKPLTSDSKAPKTAPVVCNNLAKETRQGSKTSRHQHFITNSHQHASKGALTKARSPGNGSRIKPATSPSPVGAQVNFQVEEGVGTTVP